MVLFFCVCLNKPMEKLYSIAALHSPEGSIRESAKTFIIPSQ